MSKEWVLSDVADNTALGSSERIARKAFTVKKACELATNSPSVAISGKTVAEIQFSEAESRFQEAEERARVVEMEKEEAEREKEVATREKVEAENRRQEAEERAMEAERGKEEAEARCVELAEEARASRERITLMEQRLTESDAKLQQLETQWVVERREIQLTDQELGRGGWATVFVATFRGTRVAAKCVHNQIISPYNIQLFKREMDMAARIRHPNLLQFIGATVQGEMVILTELMPTSLRKELERKAYNYMSPDQAISIGLDVARALNYLHLMQPDPLIHRDISSANVLLEPLPNSHWRAKVSDYGTVNLYQQLQTGCPGNPAYSAPEANDPTQQSPKMDIFSFGILLMEMLTGEFPVSDARGRLLCKIHHQPLLALIQRCLREEREDRPSATDIISEFDQMI